MTSTYGDLPEKATSADCRNPSKPKKLLDQTRDKLRLGHYALTTEEAYVNWIRRFILFHNKRHPREMGKTEIEAFLTHLAAEAHVAPSTQNQAFNALLFLYRHVLGIEFPDIDALRARPRRRLPVVLSQDEVRQLSEQIERGGWPSPSFTSHRG